ncbi:hypothetical protein HHI36_008611 [Cryptolaemus montrouzieri]|uniref:Uncharacterized protein n=1 Tax=Cryptolaemus montrouzieri TaxID=559131 RepID=A0ABD2MTW1_9CUCU
MLALAISENKQATEKIVQEKNYDINFDDELTNASCLEMINFFSEIDENLLDNIPIVFQLAHNNDDTNYLLQCDDGGEKNSPDSVVERVDIGNLELDTNLSENRESGMAFTENSTTIDIENCDKRNCGDDESGGERVENENQMNNAENTEKNCEDDEDKNVDETVKKLKNFKRNRKSNSNTWERMKNKKLRMGMYVSSMLNDQGIRVRRDARKLGQRRM